MNLKRYRVKNIKEALAFIKRDLGPDALIVSTRQVKEGKGALGMFGKTMLEVTAAASETKKPPAQAKAIEKFRHDSDHFKLQKFTNLFIFDAESEIKSSYLINKRFSFDLVHEL